jgi:CubicO group peptidase (beta-lactamase class C family)
MEPIQKELEALIAPWQNIPGVAVCLVFADRAPVFACSGYSNLEYQLRMDENTRFNIASVSKQFTGFAIRLLEKRGLLQLDDPLQKYLPEMSQTYKDIQIHHLLHHTSGLRCMFNIQAHAGYRRDDVFTREQILALTNRQTSLNFFPGERFIYNNTGYILMAEIIQRLSGMNLRRFLETEIFAPLNMQNTFLSDDHVEVIPDFAGHYNLTEEGVYTRAIENVAVSGSSNIVTSISDFSRWLGNFVTPRLEPDVMMGLDLTHPFNDGSTNAYACGIELSERAGRKMWAHGGGAGGFRSHMIFIPDARVAVGVLSNNGTMDATTLGEKALGLVIAELAPKGAKGAGPKPTPPTKNEWEDLAGCYRLPDGLLARIEISDNSLYIHTPYTPFKLPLLEMGGNRYKAEGLGVEMEVEYDEQGKICAVVSESPMGSMRAEKLATVKTEEPGLAEYSGKYWSEELLNMWEVGITGGHLSLFHPHFPDLAFFPVLKDEFSSENHFFGKLKFIRNANDEVIALEMSGDRAINIHFKRVKEIIYQA